ncbi:hypothetical protein VKS41_008894 [Umbelopsis sp. WA50703]
MTSMTTDNTSTILMADVDGGACSWESCGRGILLLLVAPLTAMTVAIIRQWRRRSTEEDGDNEETVVEIISLP